MQIVVRYYAAARELAGIETERLSLEKDVASVLDVREILALRHERLAPYLQRMRFAINGEFAELDETVPAQAEVDVMPPVAGGVGPGRSGGKNAPLIAIRHETISIDEAYAAVRHDGAGGVVVFVGVVRDQADGKAVARLDYEAHEVMAEKQMRVVISNILSQHDGVRIAALHRVGELCVGDIAVVVAVSAPHRADAFVACRQTIDDIKESVPIWKKEFSPDGEAIWVNLEIGD